MMCGCDRGVSQSDGTCSKAEDGIIIDNNDPEFSYSGAWESSSNVLGFYGSYYLRAQPWYGPATASWTPTIPQVAQYHVYGWWREHFSANGSYRATNAPLLINHAGQQDVIHVDFSDYHKGWKYLGTFYFAAGTGNSVTLSNTPNPGGDIVADAFRFVQITAGTTSTVEPTTTTTIQPTTSTTALPTTTISSTTTTAPVGRCPAKTVMGEGSPDLRKLHTLRNEIFLKDAVGKQYTALYYKHALELSNIFANDRKLRKGAQSLIQKIMPAIEGVLNKRDASVREELIQESIGLIDSLRPKVSPALENDLTCLESDIQSGVIFKTFGITIQKNKS
jgi:hypothetical protein